MSTFENVELQVWNTLKKVVPAHMLGPDASRDALLREDLNVSSLGMISIAMELSDSFGFDPAALDLGTFIERAETVSDLIKIVEEIRFKQGV